MGKVFIIGMNMEKNDYIFGIRAVIEAIEAGREIDKIFVKKDLNGDLANELLARVKERGLVCHRVPVEKIDRITRKNHQGVVAMLAAVSYCRLDDIVPQLYEDGKLPFIVLLDGVTDVRNFGAIARTCECAGVDAIVIPERGSVSVNADAVKTSAGALHYLTVCREKNLTSAVKFLKNTGYKVYGAAGDGSVCYTEPDYTEPTAIVLGSEDEGISRDVLRLCDRLVSIPEFGNIKSLNVSVAAGVLMYEVVRQRSSNS